MCVVVNVGFVTGGECHPIVGPGNSYVIAFVFLIVGQDVECISPCSWVPVDALREIILVVTEFRQPLQVQSHLEMPRILVQLGHTQST